MKLFYYQRPDAQPNFGDELNHWMWPQLRPDLFDSDSTDHTNTAFVGMGTLLNNKLAERVAFAKQVAIFSTGAGYEQPLKQIPANWTVHCVRGPFSARRLGLPQEKAIADGGLLVALLVKPADQRTGVSFMPHIHSASAAAESWQRICTAADIKYIDPRWPVEDVLSAIVATQQLLTEAMHGAIIADALRVPWTPLTTSPRIYAFKWQDWCASMGLPYLPHRLPPLAEYDRWSRGIRSGALAAKHWARAGLESPKTTLHYALSQNESAIAERLKAVATQASYLSSENTFQTQLDRLQTCLQTVIQGKSVSGSSTGFNRPAPVYQ